MRFVVQQAVAVAHQPGRRIVAGDGQGVAQRGRHALRQARRHAATHQADAPHAQGLYPVRRADVEAACDRGRLLAGVRPRRFARPPAIQQVVLVHDGVATLAFRDEVGDGHPVIVVLDGQGQGRRAHVAVTVGQGVGEHFAARAAPRQRHELGIQRRQGVAVGAIGIEHQAAVGAGQVGRGHRRAIRPLHVIADDIAVEDEVVLARRGRVAVVHRRRHVVLDHRIQAGRGGIPILVGERDLKTLGQLGVIGRFNVTLVILQAVAVADAAGTGHGIETDCGDLQAITKGSGERLRECGHCAVRDQRQASDAEGLHSVWRAEAEHPPLCQCRLVRAGAIGQVGIADHQFTTSQAQSRQADTFIDGRDSDGQGRVHHIDTIGHAVVHRRYRTVIVQRRREAVVAVAVDREGAYTRDGHGGSRDQVDIVSPAEQGHAGCIRPIRVAGIVEEVAVELFIFRDAGLFVLITQLIVKVGQIFLYPVDGLLRVMAGVEPSLGDGRPIGTTDGDEATVTAGTDDTTYATATTGGWGTTGRRGFKTLSRVNPFQDGLLQCSYVVGIERCVSAIWFCGIGRDLCVGGDRRSLRQGGGFFRGDQHQLGIITQGQLGAGLQCLAPLQWTGAAIGIDHQNFTFH